MSGAVAGFLPFRGHHFRWDADGREPLRCFRVLVPAGGTDDDGRNGARSLQKLGLPDSAFITGSVSDCSCVSALDSVFCCPPQPERANAITAAVNIMLDKFFE